MSQKFSSEFVERLFEAKRNLDNVLDEMLKEGFKKVDDKDIPEIPPVTGITATIRWKDSGDEAIKYFSFELVDPLTLLTPSGVHAEQIFMVCTIDEFRAGFPLEPFEIVQ